MKFVLKTVLAVKLKGGPEVEIDPLYEVILKKKFPEHYAVLEKIRNISQDKLQNINGSEFSLSNIIEVIAQERRTLDRRNVQR